MGHLRGLFCERDEIGILSASSLARFKALTRLARPTGKHPGVCEVRRRRAHATTAGVTIFDRQDSSLLSVLTQANCLALRPPHDAARKAGESVQILPL